MPPQRRGRREPARGGSSAGTIVSGAAAHARGGNSLLPRVQEATEAQEGGVRRRGRGDHGGASLCVPRPRFAFERSSATRAVAAEAAPRAPRATSARETRPPFSRPRSRSASRGRAARARASFPAPLSRAHAVATSLCFFPSFPRLTSPPPMASPASLVRSAPPRDDENGQGEHRRRRPREPRRCAHSLLPLPPAPLRSAARADSAAERREPRAPPPEPTTHPAPPLVAAHPAGELRAVLRTLWSGEYAAFPVRAQPPTAPGPRPPDPPHLPLATPDVAAPDLSRRRRTSDEARASQRRNHNQSTARHPDTLIRPGDPLCAPPPAHSHHSPPSHRCSPPPHLSPTNCCARCGPWCPLSPAISSRTRTSSPGFFSSGCARNSFEAPNSPPRAVNPRGSSPAAANTVKGVT